MQSFRARAFEGSPERPLAPYSGAPAVSVVVTRMRIIDPALVVDEDSRLPISKSLDPGPSGSEVAGCDVGSPLVRADGRIR
jgi:hypothetical protein